MKILVVDGDRAALKATAMVLQKACPDAELVTTDDGMDAVQYSLNHHVDAVYTEARMPRISGFDVARLVRKFRPKATAYMVSETDEYLNMALRHSFGGYFLKALTEETFQTGNLLGLENADRSLRQ